MAYGQKAPSCEPLTMLTLIYPIILRMFGINLESITFMKVKIIVYQGKLYPIAKRNV